MDLRFLFLLSLKKTFDGKKTSQIQFLKVSLTHCPLAYNKHLLLKNKKQKTNASYILKWQYLTLLDNGF